MMDNREHGLLQLVDCFYPGRAPPNQSSHIYNCITMLLDGYYLIPSSTGAETEAQRGQVSVHSEILAHWVRLEVNGPGLAAHERVVPLTFRHDP